MAEKTFKTISQMPVQLPLEPDHNGRGRFDRKGDRARSCHVVIAIHDDMPWTEAIRCSLRSRICRMPVSRSLPLLPKGGLWQVYKHGRYPLVSSANVLSTISFSFHLFCISIKGIKRHVKYSPGAHQPHSPISSLRIFICGLEILAQP